MLQNFVSSQAFQAHMSALESGHNLTYDSNICICTFSNIFLFIHIYTYILRNMLSLLLFVDKYAQQKVFAYI